MPPGYAINFPPRIEAPQSGILSANLTVNHPNISVWLIPEQTHLVNWRTQVD